MIKTLIESTLKTIDKKRSLLFHKLEELVLNAEEENSEEDLVGLARKESERIIPLLLDFYIEEQKLQMLKEDCGDEKFFAKIKSEHTYQSLTTNVENDH